MAMETSSLELEHDFNHTEVRLQQRPLVGWGGLAFAAVLVTLVTGFFGIVPVGWEPLGVPVPGVAIPSFAFIVFSLSWKRTATFSVGSNQVGIEAWTGLLARPARLALPLADLQLKHSSRLSVNNRRVYRLTLTSPPNRRLQICALACTDEDLDTLTAVIHESQKQGL